MYSRPPEFPTPPDSSYQSLRFYIFGKTSSTDFRDNLWAFAQANPMDPAMPEQAYSSFITVRAIGGDVEVSFDGDTVHGFVLRETQTTYQNRRESGISIRAKDGNGVEFSIEAW
jgi:hypothetical protein